jgi:hypothetical protein
MLTSAKPGQRAGQLGQCHAGKSQRSEINAVRDCCYGSRAEFRSQSSAGGGDGKPAGIFRGTGGERLCDNSSSASPTVHGSG